MLTENTPYDDAFKTVIHDCKSLLIPFVNEVFQEHFTDNASVSFSSNEHYLSKKMVFRKNALVMLFLQLRNNHQKNTTVNVNPIRILLSWYVSLNIIPRQL